MSGCWVFVRKDYTNPRTDLKHKLSAVADGPFKVIEANDTIALLDMGVNQERVAWDRVTLASNAGGDTQDNLTKDRFNAQAASTLQSNEGMPGIGNRQEAELISQTTRRLKPNGLADLPSSGGPDNVQFKRIWTRQ